MRERMRRTITITQLVVLSLSLVAFFIGGPVKTFAVPLFVLTAALCAGVSLKAGGRPKPSTTPAGPSVIDPPTIQQSVLNAQVDAAGIDLSALGAESRRKEMKAVEQTVDSILEACLVLITAHIEAHTVAIFFPTNDNGYRIRKHRSKSEFVSCDTTIYPGVGVIGGFLKDGLKRLTLDDIITDSMTLYYYTRDAGIRSLIASPIVVNGVERGVIIADSTEKKHFTEEMHAYLTAAAELLGQAVFHSYLSTEHRLQYNHLVAMSSIEKLFFRMHDIDAVLDKMAEIIPYAFRCDRMTISLKNDDNDDALIRRAWGLDAEQFKGLQFPAGAGDKSLSGLIYTKNITLFRNFSTERNELRYCESEPRNDELMSFLALPLGVDICKGLIILESLQRDSFGENSKDLLTRLATSAGIAIEKIVVFKRQQSLATHDGLTGLCNHREFQHLLEGAITRSLRYKDPLALVICDLDHFKKINDTHGHRFGDVVLKSVAELLQSSVREDIDVAARYGGEEFALVLEKTDSKTAQETVERIRLAIANCRFLAPAGNEISVTMSFGIAIYGIHAKNQETLIHNADKALYRAKQNGRNRAEMYMDAEG
jgi:two-component system cell cycle response regulator